ncbi:fibroin heavy chain-like isoform X14 [Bolinopsis microptera]|uniref:fibroin heavy chain-like isoform X14 n=1 Tax=Bolinopsis microptera TaxID=2820187 RepID=UPI00307AF1E1
MVLGAGGKNDKNAKGGGKPGGVGAGKGAAGKQPGKPGGIGAKSGGMGSKSGGGMGSKPGGGFGKQSSSSSKPGGGLGGNKSSGGLGSKPGGAAKPGGFGAKSSSAAKPGGFGAKTPVKPGSAAKPGGLGGAKPGAMGGAKPGGIGAAKPGGLGAKPGASGSKPGGMGAAKPGGIGAAKPGGMGAAKPGGMGAAKPGAMGAAKPGGMGAAKPGAAGAKPGAMGAKPGAMGAKPGAMGAKPGLAGASKPGLGAKAGSSSGIGAKAGSSASKLGGGVGKSGGLGGAAKTGGIGAAGKAGGLGAGAKAVGAASVQSTVRTAVALKTAHDVTRGMAPNKNNGSGGGGFGGRGGGSHERDERMMRNASQNSGGNNDMPGGTSRNIALSQMDRLDLTKMTPRELMMLERQYGSGWLKTLAPTQFNRIQNTVGGAALTSNTPTALSSHMDPRLLQAASGIQGAGLMGAQMSQMSGADSDIPMDGEQTPNSADPTRFDAGVLATHPEQIGEGGQEGEMYDEERIPSDPIRVKLIGENLYNQQPGYDPLQEQYHMNAPLIDQGNPEHMFYQQQFPNNYPQNHKSYYHMQNPERYNFTKAVQNYDREAQNDGMYCYSCVMFFGVLMIGVGIIMIIVELFDLFGRHKNMPLAIAGGGTLALGIIILASAMLLWRRRRSNIKKKAAHV